tara:strand:- start:11035 stop:11715 length:681 start_codon:yes stop_codon:yes gene_type:complete
LKKYDVIILSGGKGTRVSNYTNKLPKCLIQVKGKPFLFYQLKYLNKYKFKNVIVSTCYMSYKIKDYVKNNINFLNVKIVDDIKPLGTGGAIVKSLKYMKKNFFIIYGDSYLNFNLNKMINKKSTAIMAIYKNNNKYDKSNVKFNDKDIIYDKNNSSNKKFDYIDYGVSYVNRKIFENLPKNKKFDLSIIFQNISKKKKLYGYAVAKRFYEIGSYKGIKDFKKYLSK